MFNTNEFKGKVLVISGGTRGIGREIVLEFARAGANVAFTYNSNADLAAQQCADIEATYGVKARAYALDILAPEGYKEVFAGVDADFGRVDFFVSNAIISGRAVVGGYTKFMKLKPRGLNNIFTATVDAFVIGAQEAARRMSAGGCIITMSSTGNRVYMENYAGHGTAKAAVEAMMRYAASELGAQGIRVNAISGGPIETDALRAFTNYEEVREIAARQSPLGRMGQPGDICGACLFLCSSKASWVTGHTFIIDGGTTFK